METKTYFFRTVRLSAPIFLLLAAGCASTQPARFYSLHSLAGQADAQGRLPDVSIGVGPVAFPEYLDRPAIVTRSSPETLQLAEFDRWAEPLDKNFARVLAENLSTLLGTDKVAVYPWPGSKNAGYQVVVEVFRFDGSPGREAVLSARYSIYAAGGKEPAVARKVNLSEPVKDSSYQALVTAEGRAVMSFSREIASAIQSLPAREP